MSNCNHEYEEKMVRGVAKYVRQMHRTCGAYVCLICRDHEGLARCFCGWARDGGNGNVQLREMGENVEDDGYGFAIIDPDYTHGDFVDDYDGEPYDIDSDEDFNPYTGSYEYFENDDSFESDF